MNDHKLTGEDKLEIQDMIDDSLYCITQQIQQLANSITNISDTLTTIATKYSEDIRKANRNFSQLNIRLLDLEKQAAILGIEKITPQYIGDINPVLKESEDGENKDKK